MSEPEQITLDDLVAPLSPVRLRIHENGRWAVREAEGSPLPWTVGGGGRYARAASDEETSRAGWREPIVLDPRPGQAGQHVAADEPGVLWMAMRYALGRATYAVGECVKAIERHAADLPAEHRERMAAEIERSGVLAVEADGPYWARAVAALRRSERAR